MSDTTPPLRPLTGIRVIEMGQLLAGPFCGQLLADFGAEVIKLEDPERGDPMREWGREKPHGLSLWWPVVARGKKSATVNLRTEDGQKLVRRLVEKSDIVIENFRPGTLERWHLGYDELRAINPRIILVRVTGYGQDGPYASRAGFGSIGEAMGGLRYITGDPDRPPSRVGVSLGDSLAGTFACLGALMALEARHRTGEGQVVDAAIYEAVLALTESLIPEWALGGYTRERTGSVLPNIAPSNVYPTASGDMIIMGANQDSVFRRLAKVMDAPQLSSDERFSTHSARGANQTELDVIVSAWTAGLDADDLLQRLHEGGVPAGRIYRAVDMLKDPHFEARQDIVTLPHNTLGDFPMQNVVPRLSATPGSIGWVGPELGEHNDEVFGDILQMPADEQTYLRGLNVI
jgi:crotonobetainyl-CoA:carnitine CoA-transferase CaiB-like acyl-CoA transferase